MGLDPAIVSRVRSFVAAVKPSFDDVLHVFFERFAKACPSAANVAPPASKRERFDFARAFADVIKQLESFHPGSRVAVRMSRRCAQAGMTSTDLFAASACLLSALRDAAGPSWGPQVESDCSAIIAAVFDCVVLPERQQTPLRMAA